MAQKKSGWHRLNLWIGLMAGIVACLAVIPLAKDFLEWRELQQYVKLNATFPDEHWKEAEVNDFEWLEGKWDIPKLRGFISAFKVEKGKLFRQNIGYDKFYKEGNFITEWMPAVVYISTDGLLRLEDSNNHQISFISKQDKCCCLENERYIANDNTLRSSEGRQMFLINETILSEDGFTYHCK